MSCRSRIPPRETLANPSGINTGLDHARLEHSAFGSRFFLAHDLGIPRCSRSELTELISEVGLGRKQKIRAALKLIDEVFADSKREDGSEVLEGHLYLTAYLGIKYCQLTGREVDERLVIDALLHDYIEETGPTADSAKRRVVKKFGAQIADDIEILTPYDFNDFEGTNEYEKKRSRDRALAQDLREADWRVVVVKGCDRLCNWLSAHKHPRPMFYVRYADKTEPLLEVLGRREEPLFHLLLKAIGDVHYQFEGGVPTSLAYE